MPAVPFLYSLKTWENLWFSNVFRGQKDGIPGSNELNKQLLNGVEEISKTWLIGIVMSLVLTRSHFFQQLNFQSKQISCNITFKWNIYEEFKFILCLIVASIIRTSYNFCLWLYDVWHCMCKFLILPLCAISGCYLTHLSVLCCISYRNQSFDLQWKSNDWFLYKMQHWSAMGSVWLLLQFYLVVLICWRLVNPFKSNPTKLLNTFYGVDT